MRAFFSFLPPVLLLVSGCAAAPGQSCPVDDIRAAVDAELQRGVRATIEEDIDAYMDGVPDDYLILEDDGSVTDKAALREYALKSWAVIDRTISLEITLDDLAVAADCQSAEVATSQRWERLMRRPDGGGPDNVVTTQKHRERWRLTGGRWLNYEIDELGGEIFINGAAYQPPG